MLCLKECHQLEAALFLWFKDKGRFDKYQVSFHRTEKVAPKKII